MPYYVVTGRVPGDDEDSLYVVEEPTQAEAEQAFRADLHYDRCIFAPDSSRLHQLHGADHYINWVLECATEPRIVRRPA